jgi:hypothetical protein
VNGEASCPSCREDGRVEVSLVNWFDGWDTPLKQAPPDELRAEEPLSFDDPPKRKSYRPVAA